MLGFGVCMLSMASSKPSVLRCQFASACWSPDHRRIVSRYVSSRRLISSVSSLHKTNTHPRRQLPLHRHPRRHLWDSIANQQQRQPLPALTTQVHAIMTTDTLMSRWILGTLLLNVRA